jgi:hypothetical protein
MALAKFKPASPDKSINRTKGDTKGAQYGHLNTIVDYINNNSAKPAGLNGYVQFNDNNALGGDPGLFWDNVNKRLGVGTVTPAYQLSLSEQLYTQKGAYLAIDGATTSGVGNYVGIGTTNPQAILHILYNYGQVVRNERIGDNTSGPTYRLVKGRGVIGAPTPNLTNDSLGDLNWQGYSAAGTTAFASRIISTTTEPWSLTNRGARLDFITNQTGTTTAVTIMNAFGTGVNIGNATSDLGARLGIKGSGSTSATTALLVQNSAGTVMFSIKDNSTSLFTGFVTNYGGGSIDTNTAFGSSALGRNSTGANNTAFGLSAIYNNTTGNNNTGVGSLSLAFNNGSDNVAVGYRALQTNTTGTSNTSMGSDSLLLNSVGGSNVAIGQEALRSNTASGNTAVGYQSGYSNTSGIQITAIGYQALKANTTGGSNTAIGDIALTKNDTGAANVAIGSNCLNNNTSGSSNVAVGDRASSANTTAAGNVAIGQVALQNTTTGGGNTAIGYNSINANTTGTNNSALGANTVSGNFSGSVILGVGATATASNQFVVGTAAINAGAVDTAVVAPTKRWKVKINGVDYYIALEPA